MNESQSQLGIEPWLSALRKRFTESEDASELLPLFETYAEEARFGRSFIADDISNLHVGAHLLEVGAGAMILSCQLAREGFKVHALEPTGSGFTHFDKMRSIILSVADETNCLPNIISTPAEMLDISDHFDYAFSVNVMEHVADVGAVIGRVSASLRRGSSYRFICPNYLFPYEPHFNMPTLFSKKLTEKLLHRRIYSYPKIPDPAGTWASLNWINVTQVERLVARMNTVRLSVQQDTLEKLFDRITTDKQFSERRSGLTLCLVSLIVSAHLHRLLKFVPASMQPIMDCRIQRTI